MNTDDRIFSVRLTADDRMKLKSLAKMLGCPPSTTLRNLLRAAVVGPPTIVFPNLNKLETEVDTKETSEA